MKAGCVCLRHLLRRKSPWRRLLPGASRQGGAKERPSAAAVKAGRRRLCLQMRNPLRRPPQAQSSARPEALAGAAGKGRGTAPFRHRHSLPPPVGGLGVLTLLMLVLLQRHYRGLWYHPGGHHLRSRQSPHCCCDGRRSRPSSPQGGGGHVAGGAVLAAEQQKQRRKTLGYPRSQGRSCPDAAG